MTAPIPETTRCFHLPHIRGRKTGRGNCWRRKQFPQHHLCLLNDRICLRQGKIRRRITADVKLSLLHCRTKAKAVPVRKCKRLTCPKGGFLQGLQPGRGCRCLFWRQVSLQQAFWRPVSFRVCLLMSLKMNLCWKKMFRPRGL